MRYLPIPFLCLLLFIVGCSSDPLRLEVVEVEDAESEAGLPAVEVSAPGEWALADEVYTSNGTESIELIDAHEDLSVSFYFRTTENTAATLMLQDRYPIAVPELSVTGPNGQTVAPRIPTSVSPNVWQQLEVVFKAATPTTPALLAAVYLNGNLLHYQQPVEAAENAGAAALRMTVAQGQVAIASLAALPQAGRGTRTLPDGEVELALPLVRYRYYDLPEGTEDVTRWADYEPVKTGYIDRFDLNAIREKNTAYAIRFDGKLEVPESGRYKFTNWGPSSGRVYVDDQLVVDNGGKHPGRNVEGFIELNEGVHDFRWDHVQNGGWNAGNVGYATPGGSEGQLNGMRGDISTPGLTEPTLVEMDDDPYLLRSFLFFPLPRAYEKAEKRTHVISVGEGDGPHYSIDLKNGSLLQVWRGQFANVHDMWDGRGEPQVVKAMGSVLSFDGRPQWHKLEEDKSVWPDSLDSGPKFRHLRHELDETGRPTFYYKYGLREMTDRLEPQGEALQRTLTNRSSEALATQLASAARITETAPGEFTLRGPGLNLSVVNNAGGRLLLQRGKTRDRLLAEVPGGGAVIYDLKW